MNYVIKFRIVLFHIHFQLTASRPRKQIQCSSTVSCSVELRSLVLHEARVCIVLMNVAPTIFLLSSHRAVTILQKH